ncbi:MAG TPA: hypothetical protein VF691_20565 [Cytophagaceae bacterium]
MKKFKSVSNLCMLLLLINHAYSQPSLKRPEVSLSDYRFIRNNYQQSSTPFLLGNAEMYGLVDQEGGGFDHVWYTDVWEDYSTRKAISGPLFECVSKKSEQISNYNQEIKLDEGVVRTSVVYADGTGYESSIFCSMQDKNLLGIKIKTKPTGKPSAWTLGLLNDKVFLKYPSDKEAQGRSSWFGYLQAFAFSARTDKALKKNPLGLYEFTLNPGDSITLIYNLTTIFDTPDFEKTAYTAPSKPAQYDQLLSEHVQAFKQNWKETASIILPKSDYAQLYYRSLYWLFSVAGDSKFLPSEGISPANDPYEYWNMIPFTYGGAGWAAKAYIALGNKGLANKMLQAHFKPEALRENGRKMFPKGEQPLYHYQKYLGQYEYLKEYSDDIWLFGHELNMDNTNHYWMWDNSHGDWQAHLNAFAASMFHNYSEYFPDDAFTTQKTYPVLRGTAEFWRNLAKWNESLKAFVLPPLNSLTEDLFQASPLDAALAAKWNLSMAARYARVLGKDPQLAQQWDSISNKLFIPQNANKYLEFLGDSGTRQGGGYQGIRGVVYLSYPTVELIPSLDRLKINNSLDDAWKRNKQGEGMITFLANWFALSDAFMGKGENAFEKSSYCLTQMDESKSTLFEVKTEPRPYFLTGYASFSLVVASMMLQSYNDTIYPFPAIPKAWNNVAFHDLPACHNIKVSGEIKGGKVKWIEYVSNGKIIHRQKTNKPAFVSVSNGQLIVKN